MKRKYPGVTIIAVGLVLMGAVLIANAYNVPIGSFEQIWPFLIVLLGVALLSQNAAERRRRAGLTFLGTLLLLNGLFFMLISLGVGRLTWFDMERLWPLLLVFLGAAFLMAYIVGDFREKSLLIPMYLLGGIGILGLPITFGTVQTLAFREPLRLWPLAILLLILTISSRPLD